MNDEFSLISLTNIYSLHLNVSIFMKRRARRKGKRNAYRQNWTFEKYHNLQHNKLYIKVKKHDNVQSNYYLMFSSLKANYNKMKIK